MFSPRIVTASKYRGGYAKTKSSVVTLLAPIGGWNRRDPLPSMPATDAIVLDNLIPGVGDVTLRNGHISQATGLGTYVESMMEYAPATASNKMFAATPTDIYNVTNVAPVGAAEVSGLTNGRWQHTMFATSAGHYLVLANGADSVQCYDGSSWTVPAITGASSANFINVARHAQRLWFVEKDTLDAWYLGTQAISGAATKFPLGSYAKLGGYLVAIGSWTRDGGSGLDDYWIAITSKGEVIIYQGTDPSSTTTWGHVGVFRIPPPIGRRCIINAGSDLGILTATGLMPLSQVLASTLSTQTIVAITDKISGAFTEYYRRAGTSFGWQVIEFPKKQLLIVNVPYSERSSQYQFVMNIRTGSWCRFTGFDAGCWSLMGDELYFGDNTGTVWKYSTDYIDNGSTISCVMQQAFSDLGTPHIKRVVQARPMVRAPTGYTPTVEIRTDYDTTVPTSSASVAATDTAQWNSAVWNVDLWQPVSGPRTSWQSVTGIGSTVSPAMRITLNQEFVLNRIDVMFEIGGYL